MDFALLASDNINLNNGAAAFSLQNSAAAAADANSQKCYGFGFLKQERAINEEDLREFKMAKTTTCSSSSCGEGSVLRYPPQRSNGCNLSADGHHQMLSFSSPNTQPAHTLPYGYPYTSNAFSRNAGINGGSMQQQRIGMGVGVRGPFSPSQWMELEHQALIYKYITANVPIPSYLLNPIRKAFESAGFSALRSNPMGWSGFQLGFSNNDPEPGRCRRTDGKKWRCSRDAVIDQKYCERHMNRGRHRSRKPVEPQYNPIPSISRGKQSENGGRSEYDHTTTTATPTLTMTMTTPPKVKPKGVDQNTIHEEFGLVCSDSLLNPLSKSQHALRQFMEEWPRNQPEAERTQLSISIPIPMVTSDFMSSTSSPTNDKLTTAVASSSPPRELEMGLGVGNVDDDDERNNRQTTNWVPISRERSSIGGPLGEVLHHTNNNTSLGMGDMKQLNLIDRWDNHNSPRLASSPTGVLQRGAFASLSNSSAASSPRPESSNHCNGFINPSSLPAL